MRRLLRAQLLQHRHQARAVAAQVPDGELESSGALRRESDDQRPPVVRMKPAFDKIRRLGSPDEFGGRAACDLQALGDLSETRTAGVALGSLHDEEQLVLGGSEAVRGEDLGAPPLEPAKRSPQVGIVPGGDGLTATSASSQRALKVPQR